MATAHARPNEKANVVTTGPGAATAAAAKELVSRFEVTTVVHNAGVIRAALLPEVQLSDLDALVDLHLGCAIQLVQAALPAMRARRFGLFSQ